MNINEFAERIGVSRATVSRAVLGKGRVSDATRRMILARARELGYTPNANGQRLVTGRSLLVALDVIVATDGPRRADAEDTFVMEVQHAIVHHLHERGYNLLLHSREGTNDGSGLRRMARSRAVDGIILGSMEFVSPELLQAIAGPTLPCVGIDISPCEINPYVASVVMDLAPGIEQAVEALATQGHRRIAYIGKYRAPKGEDFVFDCFVRALQRRGLSLPPELCVITSGLSTEAQAAMQGFLRMISPPTAIFARKDGLALGALYAALDRGVRVPQDISLIGYDDGILAALAHPPLTTVRMDARALGAAAVRLLFDRLDGKRTSPEVIPTALVERQTVGRARGGGMSGGIV